MHLIDHLLLLTGSAKDIDVAVAAAREAFNTTWGKNVSGFERARLLNKLADLIEANAQELGELEALNNGKPVRIARCVAYYGLAGIGTRTEFRPTDVLFPGAETSTLGTASDALGTTPGGRTRSSAR